VAATRLWRQKCAVESVVGLLPLISVGSFFGMYHINDLDKRLAPVVELATNSKLFRPVHQACRTAAFHELEFTANQCRPTATWKQRPGMRMPEKLQAMNLLNTSTVER
jgi:hypothetical protein